MCYQAQAMRLSHFNTVFLSVLVAATATGLLGCTGTASERRALRNQWLASNYPNRAAHLDKLPSAQPFFRDAVIAGQIQVGMTVEEVLIATNTAPYGPKRYQGNFWCNDQVVTRCAADCRLCQGVIFIKDQLLWFSGEYQPPTVTTVDNAAQRESIFQSTHSASDDFRVIHIENKRINLDFGQPHGQKTR